MTKPLKVHLVNPHAVFCRTVVEGPDAEWREETDAELRERIQTHHLRTYSTGLCSTWTTADMRASRACFEATPLSAQCKRCRFLGEVTKSGDEERAISVEAMLIGLSRIWDPEIEPQKGLARIDWLAKKYA